MRQRGIGTIKDGHNLQTAANHVNLNHLFLFIRSPVMKNIVPELNQVTFKKLIWVLAISETIHNLEEALWLPAWSQSAGVWHPAVGAFEFRFAVTIVTLIFYGVIYYFSTHENTPAHYLMGGALVMILFNVLVPHVLATVLLGRYAPGVASGILLNVPVCAYLLWRGLHEGIFTYRILVLGALGFAAVMIPLLPVSFALGRFVQGVFA